MSRSSPSSPRTVRGYPGQKSWAWHRSAGRPPDFDVPAGRRVLVDIGPAVAAIVHGAPTNKVAEDTGFAFTTIRDWRRRHRERAPVLAAGFAGPWSSGPAHRSWPAVPERVALEALGWAWDRARSRFGTTAAGRW